MVGQQYVSVNCLQFLHKLIFKEILRFSQFLFNFLHKFIKNKHIFYLQLNRALRRISLLDNSLSISGEKLPPKKTKR